ncbi:MATE family efflux transporter [Flavisolibacter nicotianae]|uniref:MATE family efflux transporter n=1 Tax=Flavisolibacter nicotianae TaxID=2364882 RepID=UPI000EB494DA|nr:MATE family efflux transporter [Flavisolibacter nicotianae]
MSQTVTQPKVVKAFSLFIRAVKGEPQDYTVGSIRQAIFLLAVPMILEMGMESVFALVDLFFVSRLGKHAVSTVGLTESVLTIIYSIAIGVSMAAAAMVARRIGEKNEKGAASAAMQSLWLSLAIILFFSITGVVFAADILRLMGAETETIGTGATYTRIMMASSTVIMLLFLINGIFRGAGDASIAMRSLAIANGFNIVLCPLLINGLGPVPAFGITGAAMATSIGRSIGVCYQLYHLFNGKSVVRLSKASLKIEGAIIRSLVKIAWPATFQFIIASCSWIFLAQLVAETGHSAASAGYQTAIRIIMFFLLPAWGISNAAATLVGQNLGAKNLLRAEQSVEQTAKYNAIFMGMVSLLFLFFPGAIVGLFTPIIEVQQYAITALRIISAGYIFYGIGMVLINAFNGAGDTRTPTVINIFCFWLFQLPLAYLLAKYFALGPKGVFIAIPVAEMVITVAAFILFKKGRWKAVKI